MDDASLASGSGAGWRALADLGRLATWMDERRLGSGPIEEATPLSGGTQNLILRFRRAGRTYVLRRPPLHPFMDGSETMRREARVLGALAGSRVPHPGLIADCPDEAVLGAAFYLMEPVDGFCALHGLPPLFAAEPAFRHAMGLSAIDGLAALRAVDYRAVGLEGFGKPAGFLERQAPRWLKQLDSYAQYPGWNGRADLLGVDAVADWLMRHMPRRYDPGIIHGDFHLGNVLFSRSGPEMIAIVDWELATLGDPMIDLGTLLATWADPDGSHPGCISVSPWSGFPTEAELVDRYACATGRDVLDVNWFVVLACFKLAILQEGTYARAAAGQADPAVADWLHATSIKLLERAQARI